MHIKITNLLSTISASFDAGMSRILFLLSFALLIQKENKKKIVVINL